MHLYSYQHAEQFRLITSLLIEDTKDNRTVEKVLKYLLDIQNLTPYFT